MNTFLPEEEFMPHNNHSYKRRLILNIINHLGPISRTELINLTDYRPASISDIIKGLLEEQLIVETGNYSAGHGRRRTLLEINKTHLCAIGMVFTSNSVNFIVSQVDGSILKQDLLKFSPDVGKDILISQIIDRVKILLDTFHNKEILGIGIGEPHHDPTGYQTGGTLSSDYSHFNDWVHLGLKPRLEELFQLHVEVYSGVTLPVMAQQHFGVAKGVQNFICIELSNGIGASICCNGVPVTGAKGMSGELGHTVISYGVPNQKLCYCGKPGCVENSTAYPYLIAELKDALNHGVFSTLSTHLDSNKDITISAIRKALGENDRLCMYHVKNIAARLGVLIANTVNLLNPELVVLYGFMLELGDYFLNQLETSIRENVLSIVEDFEIRISDSLETILPLGAVAEIYTSYLRSDDYKWVYQLQPSDLEEWSLIQGAHLENNQA